MYFVLVSFMISFALRQCIILVLIQYTPEYTFRVPALLHQVQSVSCTRYIVLRSILLIVYR